MQDHVVFINQFVDQATLLDFISMCDVYATPYLNEAQMTSGTLAYSFGLGKAVISTPYWHAMELLDNGRGILVPFGNSKAIGSEIAALLTNDVRAAGDAQTRVRGQPIDDMGANSQALSGGIRVVIRGTPDRQSRSCRPKRLPARRQRIPGNADRPLPFDVR